ncbi:hypothetical protein BDV06DRAFT_227676 [Aspergillus oleicola]
MARPLMCASMRLWRATAPTAPALYGQIPASPVVKWVNRNRRAFTSSPRRLNKDISDAPHIELGDDRFRIELNGKATTLSYFRLRDFCQCRKCVDEYSKQRNFRLSDIPTNIKPKSLRWFEGQLEATWENDAPGFDESHVSRYTWRRIFAPAIDNTISCPTGSKRSRVNWNKEIMEYLQPWISFDDYMHDNERFTRALAYLAQTGILFVKDIPDSREMVAQIATRIGPLRNTFYGPTWAVRTVPKATNVAYTSQSLGFHMDLMYMKEAPGFQLLHCIQNSCDGGESLFSDAFWVAEHMYEEKRAYYEALTKLWLPYEYMHKEHRYVNWRPVFEKGPNKQHGSRLQAVNYSPPFQGPLYAPDSYDPKDPAEQKLTMDALAYFADRLEDRENMFELKLKPGQCVIFENRRIVHARRGFNTAEGERWLAGAYLDEDVVQSQFRVRKRKDQRTWRFFNDEPVSDFLERVRESAQAREEFKQSLGNGESGETRAPLEVKEPGEARQRIDVEESREVWGSDSLKDSIREQADAQESRGAREPESASEDQDQEPSQSQDSESSIGSESESTAAPSHQGAGASEDLFNAEDLVKTQDLSPNKPRRRGLNGGKSHGEKAE